MDSVKKITKEEYREVARIVREKLEKQGCIRCEAEDSIISFHHNIKGVVDYFANGTHVFNDQKRIKLDLNGETVPIDHRIAATIALLNQKGYKTKFCCSGHFSDCKLYFYDAESRKIVINPYISDTPNYYFIAGVYEHIPPIVAEHGCLSHMYISFDGSQFKDPKIEALFREKCNHYRFDFEFFYPFNFATIRARVSPDYIDETNYKLEEFAYYLPKFDEFKNAPPLA